MKSNNTAGAGRMRRNGEWMESEREKNSTWMSA